MGLVNFKYIRTYIHGGATYDPLVLCVVICMWEWKTGLAAVLIYFFLSVKLFSVFFGGRLRDLYPSVQKHSEDLFFFGGENLVGKPSKFQ